MFNTFCLYSDALLTRLLVFMKFCLVHESRCKHKSTTIYIDSAHLEMPNMSFRCISDKLKSVKKTDKKWTFQNILKRLRATCFSPSRDIYPKFNQGVEKIAAHFQVNKFK